MKTTFFAALLAAFTLAVTVSSAQEAQKVNPYAALGHTPFIAGKERQSNNVFVIENFEDGSVVGKLEHNPQTGEVRLFDKNSDLLGTVLLSEEERAFISIDPRAEKYYSISPYAYVANNPLRFIDPTGMDIWEMDYQGRVVWIEKSDVHTMYALNSDGARTGQSITISDRSIFDNLASTGSNSGYTASYSGGNPSELASVFLFGADNSSVEWRFSRYNQGNGDQYAVGTIHDTGFSPSPQEMGFSSEHEIAFIHSHPSEYSNMTGQFGEHGSMGWRVMSDAEADFGTHPRGTPVLKGDSRNVQNNDRNQHPGNANYYTYFPHSGNIYQVRGIQYPAYVRNIKNHGYNSNRLFWGTLNGR